MHISGVLVANKSVNNTFGITAHQNINRALESLKTTGCTYAFNFMTCWWLCFRVQFCWQRCLIIWRSEARSSFSKFLCQTDSILWVFYSTYCAENSDTCNFCRRSIKTLQENSKFRRTVIDVLEALHFSMSRGPLEPLNESKEMWRNHQMMNYER